MQYRRLGRSGLRVSELSLGSCLICPKRVDVAAAREMLALAMDSGSNFFDNAEAYAGGRREGVMGEAIRALESPRLDAADAIRLDAALQVGHHHHGTVGGHRPSRDVFHRSRLPVVSMHRRSTCRSSWNW